MASLLSNMINPMSPKLLDEAWRHCFEDHLTYFRSIAAGHDLDMHSAFEHRGNFYGYLRAQGYPEKYHWYYLRLNGWHDPVEFTEEVGIIMLLDPTHFEELYNKFLTTNLNEESLLY